MLSLRPVLKIANVTWKGRCGTHPKYNPREDGEGGIRGGCRRCQALLEIFDRHRKLLSALREFGSSAERKPREEAQPDRQPSLFD